MGQNAKHICGLKRHDQDKSTRDEIDEHVRLLTSGWPPGRDRILPYLKSTHCVCNEILVALIGHQQARDTSQDGQQESGVRERVNLTPMPGRPEVNHLT